MKIKGIIFDADGTLLDSMEFWDNTVYDLLKEFGVTPDDDLLKILTPMSMHEGAQYLKKRYNLSVSAEKFIEKENLLVDRFYSDKVSLKCGAYNLIQALADKNIPMTVASATDRHLIEKALRKNEIYDYFKAVVSCSDVGEGKSSPAVYHKARSFLGTSADTTAVFEDSPHALSTVKNAGFITIGVYDKLSRSDLRKELCDIWLGKSFDISLLSNYLCEP